MKQKKHKARLTKTAITLRLLIVVGIIGLSYIGYSAFTTPMKSRKPDVQTTLNSQVPNPNTKDGRLIASPVKEGEALVYMRIPRLGKDWNWVAVEGVNLDDIAKGPGHYPDSALPGDKGNVAFAGHRTTHGQPFFHLDTLEVGDKIYLSQQGVEWEYEVTKKPTIIEPNNWKVVAPINQGSWLTLTTCNPQYGSSERMYVRAKLVLSKVL